MTAPASITAPSSISARLETRASGNRGEKPLAALTRPGPIFSGKRCLPILANADCGTSTTILAGSAGIASRSASLQRIAPTVERRDASPDCFPGWTKTSDPGFGSEADDTLSIGSPPRVPSTRRPPEIRANSAEPNCSAGLRKFGGGLCTTKTARLVTGPFDQNAVDTEKLNFCILSVGCWLIGNA